MCVRINCIYISVYICIYYFLEIYVNPKRAFVAVLKTNNNKK